MAESVHIDDGKSSFSICGPSSVANESSSVAGGPSPVTGESSSVTGEPSSVANESASVANESASVAGGASSSVGVSTSPVDETADGSGRRRRFRRIRRIVWLALVVAALATFPGGWGARSATWVARRVLAFGDPSRTRLTVERLSPWRIVVRDVSLGGIPGEPAFDSLVIRYSPVGLLRHRVDSLMLSPVHLDPATFNKPLPKTASRSPAPPPTNPDPLRGWRVASLRAELAPMDLAPLLPETAHPWLPDAHVSATLSIDGTGPDIEARLTGRAFGGALDAHLVYDPAGATGRMNAAAAPDFGAFKPQRRMTAAAAFTFSGGTNALHIAASGEAGVEELSWRIAFSGEAEGSAFSAKVEREPVTIDEDDPMLASILAALPLPKDLTDLRATATVSASATVVQTEKVPVPVWEVETRLSEIGLRAKWQEHDLALRRGGLRFAATGVGNRWVMHPMRLGFASAKAGRLDFDGGYATFLADEESLLVSEASVGFCGGRLRLYALSLDLKRMSSGFTILLDGLDAGRILAMFPEVGGTATGTLNGKIPLGLRNVSTEPELRLRNAFLHAPPGDTGKLCLSNTQPIVDYLLAAGVPGPTCRSLGEALHNLDYTLLRLDLSNAEGEENHLVLRLSGSSTTGKTKTPVDLNIGIHGDIQRLLNFGIRAGSM